ncbi:hypothetical protein LCGC14_2245380 [marine sediment metagenome]|uniref:Uncharacterized protein n=1 Tax=marine sediment metagenome TaxID=412755 RepID=A0A0F9D3X4_9ZZZZ
MVAGGASPRSEGAEEKSPAGATEMNGVIPGISHHVLHARAASFDRVKVSFAPSGLRRLGCVHRGLAPPATVLDPFGVLRGSAD